MADSIAKFFDRQIKPPRGGWRYPLPNGNQIERHSESDLLQELKKWRQNNGTFISDIDLERELWSYYCSREPRRCRPVWAESAPRPVNKYEPIEVTAELQGPPIWTFLNTLAVQWQPGLHDYFIRTVETLSSILVCPICRHEWQVLCRNRPPHALNSRLAVCQWVNAVHNEVNSRINKQPYPYSRMVTEYGAPLS